MERVLSSRLVHWCRWSLVYTLAAIGSTQPAHTAPFTTLSHPPLFCCLVQVSEKILTPEFSSLEAEAFFPAMSWLVSGQPGQRILLRPESSLGQADGSGGQRRTRCIEAELLEQEGE